MLRAITQVFTISRIKKGWSKAELAKRVSVSPAAIVRIEQGHGVREQNAKRIATALDKDIFDLFEVSQAD